MPGEVSLAHHGVRGLDARPECQRHILEVLRQLLEAGVTSIASLGRRPSGGAPCAGGAEAHRRPGQLPAYAHQGGHEGRPLQGHHSRAKASGRRESRPRSLLWPPVGNRGHVGSLGGCPAVSHIQSLSLSHASSSPQPNLPLWAPLDLLALLSGRDYRCVCSRTLVYSPLKGSWSWGVVLMSGWREAFWVVFACMHPPLVCCMSSERAPQPSHLAVGCGGPPLHHPPIPSALPMPDSLGPAMQGPWRAAFDRLASSCPVPRQR
jgi:hypothetical protein